MWMKNKLMMNCFYDREWKKSFNFISLSVWKKKMFYVICTTKNDWSEAKVFCGEWQKSKFKWNAWRQKARSLPSFEGRQWNVDHEKIEPFFSVPSVIFGFTELTQRTKKSEFSQMKHETNRFMTITSPCLYQKKSVYSMLHRNGYKNEKLHKTNRMMYY